MGDVPTNSRRRGGGDLLAIGFAVTVATWLVFYLAAMPLDIVPIWPALIAVALCLTLGGYALGLQAGRGWHNGVGLGAAVGAVSLLILLSLLVGETGEVVLEALWWFVGFVIAASVLCGLGAALARRVAPSPPREVNWTARFAWVTAATILLMLIAGGVVTGLEAGLAVDGWLQPEGHLMVLFPVSLMRRDLATFVEHAHRLWGLLVGLITIALAIHLWVVDRRWWLRLLGVGVVLAVIVQGTLGGTRVTQESVALGIVHGVVAHAIFAALVAIAVATSSTWLSDRPPTRSASAATDRTLAVVLMAAIGLQITLGTLFRHLQPLPDAPRGALMGLLHGHSFLGSVLVVVLVIFCGARAWGMDLGQPMVRRSGKALIHTMILQVVLGIGAFIVVPKGPRGSDDAIGVVEVAITTAHQATGAILLAAAVALFAWERRLLVPAPAERPTGPG